MSYPEWAPLYTRLCKAYTRKVDGEQCAEWWKVLRTLSTDAVERAITKAVETERFFPPAAVLREYATTAARTHAPVSNAVCDRCGGNTWVPGPPIQLDETHVYETVIRCPVCWTLSAKSPAA